MNHTNKRHNMLHFYFANMPLESRKKEITGKNVIYAKC